MFEIKRDHLNVEKITENTIREELPKVLKYKNSVRNLLIEQNKNLKKGFEINYSKMEEVEEKKCHKNEEPVPKFNEIFRIESIIENTLSKCINLESQFDSIPKGMFCYPCKENYRARKEEVCLNYMIKIDSLHKFGEIMGKGNYNLEKYFIDFPHEKEDKEKIDQKEFIIWTFWQILKKIVYSPKINKFSNNVSNKNKDNCLSAEFEEIIVCMSKVLEKYNAALYKIISDFIESFKLQKKKRKKLLSKQKIGISNFREFYCQICCQYFCNQHFYQTKEIVENKEKQIKTIKIVNRKSSDTINNIFQNYNKVLEYKCKHSGYCKNEYKNIAISDNINDMGIQKEDMYLLTCLLNSEINFNSCFLSKHVLNSSRIYKCININNLIELYRRNENFHKLVDFYLQSDASFEFPSTKKEKLPIYKINNQNNNSLKIYKKTPLIKHKRTEHCSHEGPCTKSNCICLKGGNYCEKFCECRDTCEFQFPGCKCQSGCKTSDNNKNCPCAKLLRECDPDVCHKDKAGSCCNNTYLNDNSEKRLCLSKSVLGNFLGLFSREDINENEFICEYTGEICTKLETERRNVFINHLGLNYIFGNGNETDIDAFRLCCKMRYVNHSSFAYENCFARVMYVRGNYRIGLFALRNIRKGEELYFDYKINTHLPWLETYNRLYGHK